MRAVVLLSGGLDSCVSACIARKVYKNITALTFIYGQKHEREVESARKISQYLGIEEHRIVTIDPSLFVSALVSQNEMIPEKKLNEIGKEIPPTYVPARNIIFLAYALAIAESKDADAIFIGANALDYSGYPDCRPEFIEAFQRVADIGTKRGVEGRHIKIESPLINMTKKEIIEKGVEIKAPFHLTWSCYRGKVKACGACESCLLRLKGFMDAGYLDPLPYEKYPEWYNPKDLVPLPFLS
ncbi:MAG TPA: 7-cyano-7-deazaguanine synthase QueC [Thermoplasmatales archaeon]|nr:7-cyano-7-deazaguanine synthase QueC [Thermoplasmatales archaeon]